MDRRTVIDTLREHQPELKARGAEALYLFGSVARDEASKNSDIDLFFERPADRPFTLFDLAGLRERLEILLKAKVDLMTRQAIHPRRRARIEADAVRVF